MGGPQTLLQFSENYNSEWTYIYYILWSTTSYTDTYNVCTTIGKSSIAHRCFTHVLKKCIQLFPSSHMGTGLGPYKVPHSYKLWLKGSPLSWNNNNITQYVQLHEQRTSTTTTQLTAPIGVQHIQQLQQVGVRAKSITTQRGNYLILHMWHLVQGLYFLIPLCVICTCTLTKGWTLVPFGTNMLETQ